MRISRPIACWAAIGLAGCTTSPETPATTKRSDASSLAVNAGLVSSAPLRASQTNLESETPAQKMEAYEVRASAFSDFGMSVKTNFAVQWGGQVEWMLVTGVEPSSSAARAGLAAGDKIMAIDGVAVTAMERDVMLAALFRRKRGERARILILARGEALPRFVQLTASR